MVNQAEEQDRRIVVGVDGSTGSRTALRWALTQGQLTGATVEAVSAWQGPPVYGFAYGWSPSVVRGRRPRRHHRKDARGGGRGRGRRAATGRPVTLHLERLWSRDLTITTGLVDTSSTPTLLRLLAAGRVDAARFVTHRFGLDDIIRAYDTFSDAGRTGALKVVLSRV